LFMIRPRIDVWSDLTFSQPSTIYKSITIKYTTP
jgi:hypothetical protein